MGSWSYPAGSPVIGMVHSEIYQDVCRIITIPAFNYRLTLLFLPLMLIKEPCGIYFVSEIRDCSPCERYRS
ncbi:MAG: hypothetical protein R6U40_01225, partial [Desulfobacterales bacterium]